MKSAINWYEIPVSDMNRAKKFYSTVLEYEITDMPMPGLPFKYSRFPVEQGEGVGGVLVEGPGYQPSTQGSMVYFNCGEDLSTALSKVEKAGGKVILQKTPVGAFGFMAHFTDSEGNRLALFSPK
jgi:predicted enzyme related to lactoylglutathione lyase